ncbi:MAG: AmmeMemoRadiSam system radical SAM enzyme [Deltaproteobacteria bacterium]|nr:AmmeMemoRadiSam system radical SAM enzyme [Deltaproteobacteria bacterium]
MAARDAMFWSRLDGGRVRCDLCAQRCELGDGQWGLCGARHNEGGTLRTASYGRLIAVHDDPIEKKPLFHYLPGSRSLSVATCGCNLRCDFCQNHEISQCRDHDEDGLLVGQSAAPERLVRQASAGGCASISYTYTEPTVFYEYCRDIGTAARAAGLGNVFVTNGMLTPAAVDDAAAAFLDAANVDLKSFSEKFYKEHCKGPLDGVKAGLERLLERGVWVEVTTLVIPGRNDSDRELGAIARYLAGLGRDIPWHLSRFHPDYRTRDLPPTPVERLTTARELGRAAGLRHVYIGNVPGGEGETTTCPKCGALLIRRVGFAADVCGLRDGRCAKCGTAIAGRW